MARRGRITDDQLKAARVMLAHLRKGDGTQLSEVARLADVSLPTAKRAKEWLVRRGAKLEYVPLARSWRLLNPEFDVPLTDPNVEDLEAALVAAALLDSLGEHALSKRVWALFNELRWVIGDGAQAPIEPEAFAVTVTTGTAAQHRVVSQLLQAARGGVVRVGYKSPWADESVEHIFEPWQLRLHDSAFYVRGFSRTRRAPRTFNLAHVERVARIANAIPREAIPAQHEIWGDGDPRFGIDHDRPDTAAVCFAGGFARWIHTTRWHPEQIDEWLTAGELLQRRMPYRSCRELARRLLAAGDALTSVQPRELREQIRQHAEQLAARMSSDAP